MKTLFILIAALWLSGCTVHVHKYSCVGDQCPQPVVVQNNTYRQYDSVEYVDNNRYDNARPHRHGPSCGHRRHPRRQVTCRRLNRTTKRCYADWR
jgi:hypothetical protein